MSPPDSNGDGGGLASSSSREKSSDDDSRPEQPRVDSLGEALAGVSLHSQATYGSSALATAIGAPGTSGNRHNESSNSSNKNNSNGWENYTTEAAAAAAPSSSVFSGTTTANNQASNESLQRFLSQDPSQTLGDDVFKLSHPNLPALNYEEAKTDNSGTFHFTGPSAPSLAAGGSGGGGTGNNFGEIQPRRRTDSPSAGTGTTASSRSSSPYEGGVGRTIQAYQPANTHSSFTDDSSSGGGASLSRAHGSNPSLTALDRPPYGMERAGYGGNSNNSKSGQYDQTQTLVRPDQQQQPQVLYMAVPSPDGRGQVLQPVQMLQLPGKPYTYVVPGQNGAAPAGFFPPDQQSAAMMTLPPRANNNGTADYPDLRGANRNNYDRSSAYESGRDDYTGTNIAANGFQTDPTLPYATPQRPPLDTLLGQVRRLSRDQVGCRLVQQALDEEGPMAATLILNEGLAFWGEAMVDPFGNYLFQKILEKVTPEERVMLVKSVSTRLVNASLNLHGTRSVQKVVELCAKDEEDGETKGLEESAATILTMALAPAAARLCIDSHGNHVIQRILLKLGPKHSKFVFDAVAASVGDVARHRHGCCVIQRCLDSPPNEARSHLVARIVEKALELMQDAYGNYVVQYVLDVCSDEDVQAVCESVVGKVNLLAIQKFSSNVMEKCLERCDDRVKELYLQQMSDPERIRELMMDPFGNYVVQRALSVATHAQAIRLVEAMRPHLIATQTGNGQRNGGVRNTAGGRRIIAKICRRFPNFTLNPVGSQDELYGQNKGNHHHRRVQQNPHHHQQQHHHQQPAVIQSYGGGGARHQLHYNMNDPRLAQGHIPLQTPPQQQQQQSFYSVGGNAGYYDQQQFGSGSYPGM